MTDSILDLLKEPVLIGLDDVIRFNGVPVHRKESVSQHSFWVAVFCSVLCEELFLVKTEQTLLFTNSVINHALFHDLNETITGDVIYSLKYNSHNGDQIRKHMDDFVDNYLNDDYFKTGSLGNIVANLIIHNAPPIVKKLVKIGDWLALLKFLFQEQAMGNKNVETLIVTGRTQLRVILKEFMSRKWDKDFPDGVKVNREYFSLMDAKLIFV